MVKFIELVLTVLQYQAEGLLEIADVFLSTPEETRRYFHRIPTHERRWFKTNWAEAYRSRQQFHLTLNYLKRQGLVVRKGDKRKSRWFLTKQGEKRAKTYRERRADSYSSVSTNFAHVYGDGVTVVAFDIPEKERRKRDWIRMCLAEMGFQKLQKSVWVARGKVDEDFFRALRERDLLGKVHIFAVTKRGTIYPETN